MYIVTINVLWLFPMVPWAGLQYVIVVFPDHTHLLFVCAKPTRESWQCFIFLCELCNVIVNIHIITLQLLLPKAKQFRFTRNYTCDQVNINNRTKLSIFTLI